MNVFFSIFFVRLYQEFYICLVATWSREVIPPQYLPWFGVFRPTPPTVQHEFSHVHSILAPGLSSETVKSVKHYLEALVDLKNTLKKPGDLPEISPEIPRRCGVPLPRSWRRGSVPRTASCWRSSAGAAGCSAPTKWKRRWLGNSPRSVMVNGC